MKPRIVYLRPGELLDVRFISEHDDRTASDWNAKSHPGHILMGFPLETVIEVADPAVTLTHRFPVNQGVRRFIAGVGDERIEVTTLGGEDMR